MECFRKILSNKLVFYYQWLRKLVVKLITDNNQDIPNNLIIVTSKYLKNLDNVFYKIPSTHKSFPILSNRDKSILMKNIT